jgi:hypothetical protein
MMNMNPAFAFLSITMCSAACLGAPCERSFSAEDDCERVVVRDGLAFVASGGAGLSILSLDTGGEITELANRPTTNGTMDVWVEGSVAYLADGYNGLICLDVSDPSDPIELGSYVPGNFVSKVVVQGGIAYIIEGFPVTLGRDLICVDVTDPSAPVELGSLLTPGFPQELLVDGDLAFIPDASQGLQVVDVSDPTQPSILSSVGSSGGGWCTSAAIYGDYLYVGQGGIRVYDISTASAPVLVDSLSRPAGYSVSDMLVTDGMLVVSQNSVEWRAELLTLSDPAHPFQFQVYEEPIPGAVTSLADAGDRIVLGTREYGIVDGDPDKYLGEQGITELDDGYFIGLGADCAGCAADLTGDGTLSFFDVSTFLNAYSAMSPVADFNQDGVLNFFDVSVFLNLFQQGCP